MNLPTLEWNDASRPFFLVFRFRFPFLPIGDAKVTLFSVPATPNPKIIRVFFAIHPNSLINNTQTRQTFFENMPQNDNNNLLRPNNALPTHGQCHPTCAQYNPQQQHNPKATTTLPILQPRWEHTIETDISIEPSEAKCQTHLPSPRKGQKRKPFRGDPSPRPDLARPFSRTNRQKMSANHYPHECRRPTNFRLWVFCYGKWCCTRF